MRAVNDVLGRFYRIMKHRRKKSIEKAIRLDILAELIRIRANIETLMKEGTTDDVVRYVLHGR